MNNKTMKNSYVKNQFDGYSGNKYMKHMQYKKLQTSGEGYKDNKNYENYNYEYQNPKYYQGGVDPSGSVYVNSNYNIAAEDPGLSWVL
jgi:hypothetical protein